MRWVVVTIGLIAGSCATGTGKSLPLPSGEYVFQHRFAEHPNMRSTTVGVTIQGSHIMVVNETPGVFPTGVIAEGTLMWHAATAQWIIGRDPSDRNAKEVGGCSDGPEVVDLRERLYWTC